MDKDVYIYFTNTDTGVVMGVEVGNVHKGVITDMIKQAKEAGEDLVIPNKEKDIIVDFNTLMTSIIQVVLINKEELDEQHKED